MFSTFQNCINTTYFSHIKVNHFNKEQRKHFSIMIFTYFLLFCNLYTKFIETSYTYAQYQRSGQITAPATTIPRFKKYSVDDFHFLTVLGKGSFGKVYSYHFHYCVAFEIFNQFKYNIYDNWLTWYKMTSTIFKIINIFDINRCF